MASPSVRFHREQVSAGMASTEVVVGRIGKAARHPRRGLGRAADRRAGASLRRRRRARHPGPGRRRAARPVPAHVAHRGSTRWHQDRLLVRSRRSPTAPPPRRRAACCSRSTVDDAETPEDPEEFYDHQLVGLRVETVGGRPVGCRWRRSCTAPRRTCCRSGRTDGRETLVPVRGRARARGRRPGGRIVVADRPGLLTPVEEDGGAPEVRIDVVSIFPDYLAPLDLSLPGKAQESGLLDVRVHDLRRWTHDRHRTVDDTPYGGGAGMVMKPEPWGEALDELTASGEPDTAPVLVVPTPSGEPFTQALAAELAPSRGCCSPAGATRASTSASSTTPRTRMRVREVSIGDYVLNGGEVAALAVIEAVVRLLPGFMGNPASLAEESHGDEGLLEYPVYTKPPSWRGLDVPDGAALRRPRQDRRLAARPSAASVRRERRPDLLHPSRRLDPRHARRGRRGPGGDPRRRRRDPHPAAGLLAPGGAGQRHAGRPAAARVAGRRGGRAAGVDDVRAARRRAPGRVGARTARRHHLERRPAHGRPRPPGPRPRALAAGVRRGRPPRTRPPGSPSSPGRGSAANLRMYRKAGYRPVAERPSPASYTWPSAAADRPLDFVARAGLWQT